ncbi:hypothetical protein [Pseudoduganella namucuonensis]|uniref:hypothetical protein n=1 Tax=Pseudoduganella namucuonensis TaxID=1035707 RepID=UPI001160DDF2|nr:hypothetical protein [Pseudoduganella namucuonensis]
MAEIILYMTSRDTELLRDWINSEAEVAWIVMEARTGRDYRWRAVESIPKVLEQEYSLWHQPSGPLNIPSGIDGVPDDLISDPLDGWNQVLNSELYTRPWFGGNLPGPFNFKFKETGREAPNAIGRSGFSWLGNRYASIGSPANPAALRWWRRLEHFIKANSTMIPWPYPSGSGKGKAFAFAEAHSCILGGYHPDANP